jgi:twitching motility protein PilJ
MASVAELRVQSQQLAPYAMQAADGNPDAFEKLQHSWSAIDQRISDLRNGNSEEVPTPQQSTAFALALTEFENAWRPTSTNVQKILSVRDTVVELDDVFGAFGSQVLPMQTRSDELTRILAERGAGAGQVYIAGRQVAIAERLLRRLAEIREAGENAPITADSFGRDARIFRAMLHSLAKGDPERGITPVAFDDAQKLLLEISDTFGKIERSVDQILQGTTELFAAKQAAMELIVDTEALLGAAATMETAVRQGSRTRKSSAPLVLSAIWLVMLVPLMLLRPNRRRRTVNRIHSAPAG